MKKTGIVLFVVGLMCMNTLNAQRQFNRKASRKDMFGGPIDYRNLSSAGIQLSFGLNYMIPARPNQPQDMKVGNRTIRYAQDASGRFGGWLEVGMVHYRMKASKFPGLKGKNLFHLLDWGIGFDYLGGKETTSVDSVGVTGATQTGSGAFYQGNVYGRITFQRNKKLGKTGAYHLNYGLGLNGHYGVLPADRAYSGAVVPESQVFQDPLQIQAHFTLGVTIRLKRGSYLVPNIWGPIVGMYKSNGGSPNFHWYSSSYYPLHIGLKWLHNFSKKSAGCNTGTEQDRKKNEEYMQNR